MKKWKITNDNYFLYYFVGFELIYECIYRKRRNQKTAYTYSELMSASSSLYG